MVGVRAEGTLITFSGGLRKSAARSLKDPGGHPKRACMTHEVGQKEEGVLKTEGS